MQKRLIVEPIAEQLLNPVGLTRAAVENHAGATAASTQPNYGWVTCSTCWCICKAICEL